MTHEDTLKLRFQCLLKRLGAKGPIEPVFEALKSRYQEPHRRYHNLEHISDCLIHLDSVREQLILPDSVEYALWFHDAIYTTQIWARNEHKSAALAREVGEQLGLAQKSVDRAAKMIMTSAKHRAPLDRDNAFLLDIDLGIFSASPRFYARYEQAIREEYRKVPEFIYDILRRRVLLAFLQRPSLYFTEHFQSQFGSTARNNLQLTVSTLERHARLRNGGPGFGVDAAGVWLTSRGRLHGELAWVDVEEVQITTSDSGPFRCDNFIALIGQKMLLIPGDAQPIIPGTNLVTELIQHFPDLDCMRCIAAMGCARNESVVVWRRPQTA